MSLLVFDTVLAALFWMCGIILYIFTELIFIGLSQCEAKGWQNLILGFASALC